MILPGGERKQLKGRLVLVICLQKPERLIRTSQQLDRTGITYRETLPHVSASPLWWDAYSSRVCHLLVRTCQDSGVWKDPDDFGIRTYISHVAALVLAPQQSPLAGSSKGSPCEIRRLGPQGGDQEFAEYILSADVCNTAVPIRFTSYMIFDQRPEE